MISKIAISGIVACVPAQGALSTLNVGRLNGYTEGSTSPTNVTATTAVYKPAFDTCVTDHNDCGFGSTWLD